MALAVLPPPVSQIAPDFSSGTIVIESDCGPGHNGFEHATTELEASIQLHQLALTYAAKAGIIPPRLNGMTTMPYPVNAQGVPLHLVDPSEPPQSPLRQPARYRVDVPVCRPPL